MTEANTPEIDAALAARLVAAQFPQWAHLAVTPVAASGWNNRTFHLGDEMLVRMPSARWYAAQVEKEQTWLPRLAPSLPLPIPAPLAVGEPGEGYGWRWSVYGWIAGETAARGVADQGRFGRDLAGFLRALYGLDPTGGPEPGRHNFFRGGPLATYDAETRTAIGLLSDAAQAAAASAVWEAALAGAWTGPPVWIHGDVTAGNLLVREGRLSAVIDFGNVGVGDPACDLTIAWTFLDDDGRAAFREALGMDPATWARARGWAIWKALILATGVSKGLPRDIAMAWEVIARVLADHALAKHEPS